MHKLLANNNIKWVRSTYKTCKSFFFFKIDENWRLSETYLIHNHNKDVNKITTTVIKSLIL